MAKIGILIAVRNIRLGFVGRRLDLAERPRGFNGDRFYPKRTIVNSCALHSAKSFVLSFG
jgi:hypothetical protein